MAYLPTGSADELGAVAVTHRDWIDRRVYYEDGHSDEGVLWTRKGVHEFAPLSSYRPQQPGVIVGGAVVMPNGSVAYVGTHAVAVNDRNQIVGFAWNETNRDLVLILVRSYPAGRIGAVTQHLAEACRRSSIAALTRHLSGSISKAAPISSGR